MRLFIGIPLDEPTISQLKIIQHCLAGKVGVRIEPSEKMHMTLLFIGEENDVPKVIKELDKISFSPFEIKINGVGKFVAKQRVYYASIEKTDKLTFLADDILLRIKVLKPEIEYVFKPHITIARSNKEVSFSYFDIKQHMIVDNFILYESRDSQYWPLFIKHANF